MSVFAICMVKDEVDVIEATLRHVAAQGVAGIIVADNGSTDGTGELLSELADELPMEVWGDEEVGYYQSAKMTGLAEAVHRRGAEWVWPFDADEVWYFGEGEKRLVDAIAHYGIQYPACDVLQARLWHHFPTAVDPPQQHDQDGHPAESPFERMVYRSAEEAPLGKVIVRWREGAVIEAGNHAATIPGGTHIAPTDIQVRHFPYRSEEQFVRKAINGSAAYAATDLPASAGQHWREYGVHYERGGEDALRAIFREHFYYGLPSADGLVYDPTRLDS